MKFWVSPKKCQDGAVRLSIGVAVLALLSLAGCTLGYNPLDADGGLRDALVVDRGMPDAAADAPFADAAPSDSGVLDAAPSACPSLDCDPRSVRPCSATPASACLLENAGPTCEPSVGSGREGDACVLDGDCGSTLACFATATGGRCARVCCALDAYACGVGTARCEAPSMLVGGGMSMWGRCDEPHACDVLRNDECDPGEGCYIVSGSGGTDCRPAGATPVSETCVESNDCAPGLVCAGVGVKKCARICSLAAVDACAEIADTECRSYAYSPEGTGVCSVPVSSAP